MVDKTQITKALSHMEGRVRGLRHLVEKQAPEQDFLLAVRTVLDEARGIRLLLIALGLDKVEARAADKGLREALDEICPLFGLPRR